MAFRVGGYVDALGQVPGEQKTSRNIEQGDFVRKGMVLARLRSADYSERVASLRASVSLAKAEAKFAETELGRSQQLFSSASISKAELDAKIARAEAARASVQAATAQAGEASVGLADTVLRAPMDGVILSRDIEVGTLVAPGRPAIVMADISSVKAQFAVPESIVQKIALGTPLTVHVGAEGQAGSSQQVLKAGVTRIAPAADSNGRVFSVEAELPNPDGTLRTGSVISVRLPEDVATTASLSVPLSAVVRSPRDSRGFSVFVVDGAASHAKARIQQVELGDVLGNSVSAVRGLQSGERVVTVGATLIRDGSDVVVIP
jgi:RND family efflux transporter MFP subunit